jgi:PadR family transcriptional regulator, regulatory protein PadR
MDGLYGSRRETEVHPGDGPDSLDGQWLAPFLLLCVRDSDADVGELAERLGSLGFGAVIPARVYRTMRRMREEGLIREHLVVANGGLPGSGAKKQYGLTATGESYLDFWGDSLEQYGEELGLFLRLYRDEKDGRKGPSRVFSDREKVGRGGAGAVFVLTSSGLRHMAGRPGPDRPNASGFLGYPREEIFWKDAFDLVHKDDLPLLWFLVSLVMEEPGASESIEARFRDAWGDWTLVDVSVLNVLEVPASDDTGLVVVNVRHARESASRA